MNGDDSSPSDGGFFVPWSEMGGFGHFVLIVSGLVLFATGLYQLNEAGERVRWRRADAVVAAEAEPLIDLALVSTEFEITTQVGHGSENDSLLDISNVGPIPSRTVVQVPHETKAESEAFAREVVALAVSRGYAVTESYDSVAEAQKQNPEQFGESRYVLRSRVVDGTILDLWVQACEPESCSPRNPNYSVVLILRA